MDANSKYFRRYINSFNTAFTMTSSGINRHMPPGNGAPTFMIQGVPQHQIGSLGVPAHCTAKYAQLYLIDTSEAVVNRSQISYYLNTRNAKNILNELDDWLRSNNVFVRKYKTAKELQETDSRNLCIVFEEKGPSNQHPRKWNPPKRGQMCGIICDLDKVRTEDRYRDIIVRVRESNELLQIYEVHPNYDALHYVLLSSWGK
eukprot:890304_1